MRSPKKRTILGVLPKDLWPSVSRPGSTYHETGTPSTFDVRPTNSPATTLTRYVTCGTSIFQWYVFDLPLRSSASETSVPLLNTKQSAGTVAVTSVVALAFGWSTHGNQ